ncbi:RluA family pseudouridine synthase [Pelagibius marinus]|uniref:RluA family pseudouridine synthase n=1 Tax=Pelagibius marinus TaxID=2762760 RepID=UPI0029CA731E|nr:RluA family pseudouridine synthase [Pelagibius marinus]
MSGVQQVPVEAAAEGQRLDRWFKQHFPQVTHGRLEKMLRKGEIRVDGRRVKASARLESGQVVRVPPLPAAAPEAVPGADSKALTVSAAEAEALQAAVLYRDENVIAINKPAGLAVQGGSGQRRHLDGMLDALRFGAVERPRLVHRLDRDTAGVLLLARNAPAARSLTAAFRGKDTQKIYWALVAGEPPERRGLIDLPLAKQALGGGRRGEAVSPDEAEGKSARTLFQVVESHRDRRSGETVSWLVLLPLTGRTHQLRVHCAALGTPIVGDGKYGGRGAFPEALANAKTLHLVAHELALPDPEVGTTLRVTAPLPPHMAETWQALGFTEAKGEGALQALLAYAEGLSHSPAKGQRPL